MCWPKLRYLEKSCKNIEGFIHAANRANTPVLGGAVSYVEKGAVASLGFDYYQVGVQTADYVVAILQGTAPGKLDVKFAQGSDLGSNENKERYSNKPTTNPAFARTA